DPLAWCSVNFSASFVGASCEWSPVTVVKPFRAFCVPRIVDRPPFKGGQMGIFDNAKETASEAAKQAGRAVEDAVDRVKDKADEMTAEADVKKAEAERDAVKARNEAKEDLRD